MLQTASGIRVLSICPGSGWRLAGKPARWTGPDAGWLLGRTFLEFARTGRTTGRPYQTVAMVLRYDADARKAVTCAAWGPGTGWVQNLHAGPAARVRPGRESFTPRHRFPSDEEAFDVAVRFRREHPRRLRLIGTILGRGDLRGFIATPPVRRVPPGADQPGLANRICAPRGVHYRRPVKTRRRCHSCAPER